MVACAEEPMGREPFCYVDRRMKLYPNEVKSPGCYLCGVLGVTAIKWFK